MPQALDDLVQKMQKNCRLQKLAVSPTGFIFDPQSGRSFSVNHTGLRTLELLKDGKGSTDTAQTLAGEYNVPVEVAEGSVESFLLQLGRYLQ